MDYKSLLTPDCQKQLERAISYLIDEKKNLQAARALYQDALGTLVDLSRIASSLGLCRYPKLHNKGYRVIRLQKHRYVLST